MREPAPPGYHWELDTDIFYDTQWVLVENQRPPEDGPSCGCILAFFAVLGIVFIYVISGI